MRDTPRQADAGILSLQRLWRIGLYGATMAVGTLGLYVWAMEASGQAKAMTLAFTTFVLFQFFNIFNARAEFGSVFNRQFFANGKLWMALAGVVLLQIVVVHWAPAQVIFDTVDLSLTEWLLATAVASSVLFLEEMRKLLISLFFSKKIDVTNHTRHES
jgi:Ca2+-transporting ATPase